MSAHKSIQTISSPSGFLLIDKPAGISSFDVIRQLRRQTGIRTLGHAGTLDPFATGLLIIAVNKYTRLLPLLDESDKSYEATLILGNSSTTGDPEGEITAGSDLIPELDAAALRAAVLDVKFMQPPQYSALKVDGHRAYAKARKGEDFTLPERPVTIYEFDLLAYEYPVLKYSCRVSKGTYIRSLSELIAALLKTVGYTIELRRTAIGAVKVTQAVHPDAIDAQSLPSCLLHVLDILPGMDSVTLNQEEADLVHMGRRISNQGPDNPLLAELDADGICLGLGYRKNDMLHPKVNL